MSIITTPWKKSKKLQDNWIQEKSTTSYDNGKTIGHTSYRYVLKLGPYKVCLYPNSHLYTAELKLRQQILAHAYITSATTLEEAQTLALNKLENNLSATCSVWLHHKTTFESLKNEQSQDA